MICKVKKTKAELLKQYIMSSKMGQIEMECNSENTSDANDVHLESIFLFSLSFFGTRNRNISPKGNCFFLQVTKGCIVILFYMFSQFFF